MMNQEIKGRWVAALRSGDYQQGTRYLNKDGKLCCLGVLSEIAVGDGVIEPGTPSYNGKVSYGRFGNECCAPEEVTEWAGLVDDLGRLPDGRRLADLNDDGMSFAEIADVIEREL